MTQINKIINEWGDTTTNTTQVQCAIRDYYEKLHNNNLNNLEEINQFLLANNLLRLYHKKKLFFEQTI